MLSDRCAVRCKTQGFGQGHGWGTSPFALCSLPPASAVLASTALGRAADALPGSMAFGYAEISSVQPNAGGLSGHKPTNQHTAEPGPLLAATCRDSQSLWRALPTLRDTTADTPALVARKFRQNVMRAGATGGVQTPGTTPPSGSMLVCSSFAGLAQSSRTHFS